MNENIKVSVLLITYNNSEFVKQAIESIFMQVTSYKFEIVVTDDCSKDSTLEVIKHYKGMYPEKIKILDNKKNVGITKNYERGFKACSGEYIALLEGDDYWVSPYKLQIQTDFLDSHKEYSGALNRYVMYDMDSNVSRKTYSCNNFKYITIRTEDLIRSNLIGNFSSCIYRNEVIKRLDPVLFDMEVYDWMFNIAISQKGPIAYLPEVTSVYRIHSNGAWNGKSGEDKIKSIIKSCDDYNKFLRYKYNDYFLASKASYEKQLQEFNGKSKSGD
ncbi:MULTISPECIES: glycosyltransferase [Clostridium]|uniref:glycosyltransferase n=1 Tax=Clostridium TaxID=1485 RepID=UPI00069F1D48|nr:MULTISPECIES: glycosyltransferase [Clostridium]KOF55974.1 glycosyl transferase [Clostridium sp. DMHC 10]MCD2345384.1 glycosyltransferase [Clostridium guangxiense]